MASFSCTLKAFECLYPWNGDERVRSRNVSTTEFSVEAIIVPTCTPKTPELERRVRQTACRAHCKSGKRRNLIANGNAALYGGHAGESRRRRLSSQSNTNAEHDNDVDLIVGASTVKSFL